MTLGRSDVTRRLLQFARPLLGWLAASTLFRVAGMGCGIAILGVGAAGVADVVRQNETSITRIAVILVVLALAKGLFRYLEQYTGHHVAFRLLADLRNDFYRKVEPLAPAGLMQSDHSGDLATRAMKDINRIEVFYAHTIAPVVTALVLAVATPVYVALAYDPRLAALLAGFLFVVGVVVPVLGRTASGSAASNLLSARGRLSAHVVDGIQGVREVLTFGYGDRRAEELSSLGGEVRGARLRLALPAAIRRGLNDSLVAAGMVAMVLLGASLIVAGDLSWIELVVILAISIGAFPAVLAVEEVMPDLEQAFSSARRLFDITERRPAVVSTETPERISDDTSVRFDGVTLAYGDSPVPALHDVSFVLPASRRLAIVGTSGAGKSTVVSLLLRFWDPDQGEIFLGGMNIRRLSLADLRSRIAVVSQRTHLFNDSVAENLRLAKPRATKEELFEVCRRAAIHDFVSSLPDGYDTVIGEMGEKLSGGQRQRLAIARAFLKDAPILVLDEATSELDLATEAEIQDDLERLAEGRTVLVIAHRLGTVVNADEILVLDRGRIVERGKHSELLGSGGPYSRLWARQEQDAPRSSTRLDRTPSPR
jgi:ATP-binding cassette subfamily C protein CydC